MINTRTKIANWLESATTTTTDATAVHESIHELAKREDISLSSITSYQEVLEALSDTAVKVVTDIAENHGLNGSLSKQLLSKVDSISESSEDKWYCYHKDTNEVYGGPSDTEEDCNMVRMALARKGLGKLDSEGKFVPSITKEECKMKESLAKQLLSKTSNINEDKTVDMLSDWQKQVSSKHKGAEFITVDQLSEKNDGQDIVAVIGVYSQKTESGRFYESSETNNDKIS